MTQRGPRFKLIAFFGLLLVVDWFLYFRHIAHFFQGDTVFLLGHRGVSVSDYLKEFIRLNPSGWYRPLANELIESLLFPVAGLHPIPYRIPVYATFIAITVAVYALVLALSRRHLAAAIAAFFFSIQTANAYTTYDVGFMPELLYACFYITGVLAYLKYIESEKRAAYGISLGCFVLALLSKEAAVTFPATLLAMYVIFRSDRPLVGRFIQAAHSTAPHMIILIIYLVFAVGYLNVMGITITKLIEQPQVPNSGDYFPVFNGSVLKTADVSLSWAFNIPRAYSAQLPDLRPAMIAYLKFFRALVLLLIAVVFIRSERKPILFGFAWFWITILPALPLIGHFLPYYLFLPMLGLSLIVGTAFTWLYDALNRIQTSIAATTIVLVFSGLFYVMTDRIATAIEHDGLLGGSAKPARNTLNDLMHFYPILPAGATLYFADANENLSWHHDAGGLIKMAYGTDKISVLYESLGDSVLSDTQNVFLFGIRNGHLVDETMHYRSNPLDFERFIKSGFKPELSTR
jgi:hypothetical protein